MMIELTGWALDSRQSLSPLWYQSGCEQRYCKSCLEVGPEVLGVPGLGLRGTGQIGDGTGQSNTIFVPNARVWLYIASRE